MQDQKSTRLNERTKERWGGGEKPERNNGWTKGDMKQARKDSKKETKRKGSQEGTALAPRGKMAKIGKLCCAFSFRRGIVLGGQIATIRILRMRNHSRRSGLGKISVERGRCSSDFVKWFRTELWRWWVRFNRYLGQLLRYMKTRSEAWIRVMQFKSFAMEGFGFGRVFLLKCLYWSVLDLTSFDVE